MVQVGGDVTRNVVVSVGCDLFLVVFGDGIGTEIGGGVGTRSFFVLFSFLLGSGCGGDGVKLGGGIDAVIGGGVGVRIDGGVGVDIGEGVDAPFCGALAPGSLSGRKPPTAEVPMPNSLGVCGHVPRVCHRGGLAGCRGGQAARRDSRVGRRGV